jgi:hypothetical protein
MTQILHLGLLLPGEYNLLHCLHTFVRVRTFSQMFQTEFTSILETHIYSQVLKVYKLMLQHICIWWNAWATLAEGATYQ